MQARLFDDLTDHEKQIAIEEVKTWFSMPLNYGDRTAQIMCYIDDCVFNGTDLDIQITLDSEIVARIKEQRELQNLIKENGSKANAKRI